MKKILIILMIGVIMYANPTHVNAGGADCYTKFEKDQPVAVGDVVTYELGSIGMMMDYDICGINYIIAYNPNILEPLDINSEGVGSYFGWEQNSSYIEQNSIFGINTIIVSLKTNDLNKCLKNQNGTTGFNKFAYVKFKVKSYGKGNTSLTHIQTFNQNYDTYSRNYHGNAQSYYWEYENTNNGQIEPNYESHTCITSIDSYLEFYKKAYLTDITIDNTTISNFNKETYSYNINSTSQKILIGATTEDEYKVTGDIGEKTLKFGKNTFEIKVTSSTGNETEYVLNINYEDTRSKINTLKSLTLSAGDIKFNSNTNTYNVFVEYDVTTIDITSALTDPKSKYVQQFGNRTVDLQEGDNEILIKIEAENGSINTYTLNITRKEKINSCNISSLTIDKYSIDFNPDITNYKVEIDSDISALDLSLELEDEDTTYKILGNENLQNGSTITITVSDTKGNNKIYYINITKTQDSIQNDITKEKETNFNIFIVVISVIAILTLCALVMIMLKKKKK